MLSAFPYFVSFQKMSFQFSTRALFAWR